jgi:hypothetical protein
VNVYSFRIAYASEDELKALQEQQDFDPNSLTRSILSNGQPTYKTLFTHADSEEEAIEKVDAYVAITPYAKIEDKKFV